MADSVIKTVVVDLETRYKQEGIEQAKKGLSELGGQAKTLKDTVLENITKIDKAYAELGKKKIAPNDKSFIDGYLKGIQKQLNALVKDWDKLSQTQKDSATQLIKKTDEIIKEFKLLDQTQKDLAKSSKQVQESTSNFLDSVSLLTPALGKYGFAVDKAVTSLSEYLKASKAGNASNTAIGKTLEILKGKWGGLALGIGTATAAFAAFLTKTTQGSEGLQSFTKSLSLQLDNIATNAGKSFQKGFNKGGFLSGVGQTISDFFSNKILTLSDARAKEIADEFILNEKVILQLEEINAQKDISIAKDRLFIAELSTSVDKFDEQLATLESVRAVDSQIDKNNIEIASTRLQQIKDTITATKGNERTIDDLRTISQAEIALSKAKEAADAGDRVFEKLKKALINGRAALINEFNGLLNDLSKSVDEFNFNDLFGRVFDPEKGTGIFEGAKLERDLGLFRDELQKKLDSLKASQDKTLKVPTQLQIDTEAEIKRIDGILVQIRDGLNIDLISPFGAKGDPKLNLSINTEKVKKAAEIKAEREGDSSEAQRKAFQDAQREAENALNAFFELELKKTDFLINEQQRRVDKLQEIAALGNAEQLQLEEERLNKLIAKREEAAKRQAQIDSLVKLSNTGVAISNYVKAITESAGSRTPIVAILESVALLASIFAGITQLKGAFQGFEEGTLNVSSDPRTFKTRGKSDTVPAWLAPGEIVLPVDVANEIRKEVSSVHEIPKMIKRSSGTYGYIVSENKANATYNFRNVEALLQENNRLLKESNDLIQSTQVDINFDHIGYNIQQRRKAKQDRKHKTQRR